MNRFAAVEFGGGDIFVLSLVEDDVDVIGVGVEAENTIADRSRNEDNEKDCADVVVDDKVADDNDDDSVVILRYRSKPDINAVLVVIRHNNRRICLMTSKF